MSNLATNILCRACGSRTVPHCPATNRYCNWWQCARCHSYGIFDANRRGDARFVRNDALRPVELDEGHNQ